MHPTQRGFTLIEALIAALIAGILAAVALPNLDASLCKARRADALVAMAQIQAAQERLRSRGTRYGSLGELGLPARSSAGHYVLQVSAFDESGYTLLASATGAQTRDRDCQVLRVTSTGMNVAYASGSDATLTNAADATRRCWGL